MKKSILATLVFVATIGSVHAQTEPFTLSQLVTELVTAPTAEFAIVEAHGLDTSSDEDIDLLFAFFSDRELEETFLWKARVTEVIYPKQGGLMSGETIWIDEVSASKEGFKIMTHYHPKPENEVYNRPSIQEGVPYLILLSKKVTVESTKPEGPRSLTYYEIMSKRGAFKILPPGQTKVTPLLAQITSEEYAEVKVLLSKVSKYRSAEIKVDHECLFKTATAKNIAKRLGARFGTDETASCAGSPQP